MNRPMQQTFSPILKSFCQHALNAFRWIRHSWECSVKASPLTHWRHSREESRTHLHRFPKRIAPNSNPMKNILSLLAFTSALAGKLCKAQSNEPAADWQAAARD